MVAAPEVVPAGSKDIAATPEAFVSAVPLDGVIVAKVASVVKVTTTLGIAAPEASNTVAFTVAGVLVVVNPVAESVRAMEILGAAVVVVVTPLPPQLTNKAAIAANIKVAKDFR